MLRRLGSVQLDTISVLARSHELVPYARLGAVPRAKVEKPTGQPTRSPPRASSTGRTPRASCPPRSGRCSPSAAAGTRRAASAGTRSRRRACDQVLETISAGGPMTVSDLGGGRNGGEWWDWSDTKIAVEWLLDIGELVCAERRAWKRVYDLPERALAPELVATQLDDHACLVRLVEQAGRGDGRRDAWPTSPTTTASSRTTSATSSATRRSRPSRSRAGTGRPGRTRRRSRSWRRGAGTARRCCRPSTRSCGTVPGRCGSSTSSTASRPTSRRPSASTATSRCRCWPAVGCAGASTPGARAPRWSPSGCRARPRRWPTWRPR